MTTSKLETRPENKSIEYALLTWWKCCLTEMFGCRFDKPRDYKAVITLLKKWRESIKDSKKSLDEVMYESSKPMLEKAEDQYAEKKEIDWTIIEDIRIEMHIWIKSTDENYNPLGHEVPVLWASTRIRELTQS